MTSVHPTVTFSFSPSPTVNTRERRITRFYPQVPTQEVDSSVTLWPLFVATDVTVNLGGKVETTTGPWTCRLFVSCWNNPTGYSVSDDISTQLQITDDYRSFFFRLAQLSFTAPDVNHSRRSLCPRPACVAHLWLCKALDLSTFIQHAPLLWRARSASTNLTRKRRIRDESVFLPPTRSSSSNYSLTCEHTLMMSSWWR